MTGPLPRPTSTDLVGGAALEIKRLAQATDAALSVLAIAVVGDITTATNGNGDVALAFPGLGVVAGVVVTNIYGAGGTTVQGLQVPVWTRTAGAPAGQAYVHAVSSLTGAGMPNHPVRFNAIGWGVPA